MALTLLTRKSLLLKTFMKEQFFCLHTLLMSALNYQKVLHRGFWKRNGLSVQWSLMMRSVIQSMLIFFKLSRLEPKMTQEQGRIHGYPSRVRVGRGCIWGHLITWAGAVRPKTTKTQKSKVWRTDGRTDQRTDRWTDRRTDGPTQWLIKSRARD